MNLEQARIHGEHVKELETELKEATRQLKQIVEQLHQEGHTNYKIAHTVGKPQPTTARWTK